MFFFLPQKYFKKKTLLDFLVGKSQKFKLQLKLKIVYYNSYYLSLVFGGLF